jgi:phenylalanyl-tRNA synthetase beta chain
MLVDVTNYISFDRARPLHVYDAAKLKGDIVVQLGKLQVIETPVDAPVPHILLKETFEGLDGAKYDVEPDYCVIADDDGRRTIGFGGVMGGTSTGCSIETTDVFIESAWFDPNRTARTGRATGIISDARFRFERGVDPHSCQWRRTGERLTPTPAAASRRRSPAVCVILPAARHEALTAFHERRPMEDIFVARLRSQGTGMKDLAPGQWKKRAIHVTKLPDEKLPAPEGPVRVVYAAQCGTARRVLAAPETVTWSRRPR